MDVYHIWFNLKPGACATSISSRAPAPISIV